MNSLIPINNWFLIINWKTKRFWKFLSLLLEVYIITRHGNYVIKNKKNCYIRIIKNKRIFCEYIPFEKASLFNLIILYEEVKNNKLNVEIIEKEPIDVLRGGRPPQDGIRGQAVGADD